jgi:hypothetical protein
MQDSATSRLPPVIIDSDADPFNPWQEYGWSVNEHMRGGVFEWDPSQVSLHAVEAPKNDIEEYKIVQQLACMPVLNANVLDFLLRNTHLIPDEWKMDEVGNTRGIIFWGTVYRNPTSGFLFVRHLFWHASGWCWGNRWRANCWLGSSYVALRVK